MTGSADLAGGTGVRRLPRRRAKCLVLAPCPVDLDSLQGVLSERSVDVTLSGDLGAGVQLDKVDLQYFDCAIGIVPDSGDLRDSALASIYIEMGIVLGRGIPLLVVVETPQRASPALAGVMVVNTSLENKDALSLHVGVFLRRLARASELSVPPLVRAGPNSIPGLGPDASIAGLRRRLASTKDLDPYTRTSVIMEIIANVFLNSGGYVVSNQIVGDAEFDLVAQVPGVDLSWGDGTVLVDLKMGRRASADDAWFAERRLGEAVINTGSSIGLLLYAESVPENFERRGRLVLTTSVDDLLRSLESESVGSYLRGIRNRIVHGL